MAKHDITQCVERQLALYPNTTLQDIYKFFYQDFFGPEHMISDEASARNYLLTELQQPSVKLNDSYYYYLDFNNNYVRVNLNTVTDSILTAEQLFSAFIESANYGNNIQVNWNEIWDEIAIIAVECGVTTNYDELMTLKKASAQKRPVHHSKTYNQTHNPHYRLVKRDIFEKELLPFLINLLENK